MARLFAVALLVGCSAFDPALLDSVPDSGGPDADPLVCTEVCELPNATADCVNGVCTLVSCDDGWGDCDSLPSNGCEADLASTAAHCGACNEACDAGQGCAAGLCGGRITTGLVALYTFDEGSGTTITDVSGVGSPLDLTIAAPANVTWSSEGLRFDSETIASSPGAATKIITACQSANAVTLEAWVQPSVANQSGPARIVTISTSPATTDNNAMLGQGQANALTADDRYAARLRTSTNDGPTDDGITPDATATTNLTHVVFVRGSDGSHALYVNNQKHTLALTPDVSTAPNFSGNLSVWNAGPPLSIGNEIGGGRPWLGTYQLVAVYCSALSAADVAVNFSAGP